MQHDNFNYGLVCASENKEIVVISDKNLITNEGILRYGNERLFINVFNWLAVRHEYEHDVAAALGVPVFVQKGQSAIISASVRNKGLSVDQ
jgi:hypothetical protein